MSTQTDFSTLGRLGTASGTLSGGTLRRRLSLRGSRTVRRTSSTGFSMPPLRIVLAGVGIVLLGLFVLGLTASSQLDRPSPLASQIPALDPVLEASLLSGGTQMAATGSRLIVPGGGAATGMVEVPPAFAGVEDLALHLPGVQDADVIFTEADAPEMLALAPIGEMVTNANPAGYDPVKTFEGPGYHVAEATTGVRPATGLARVLLAPGTQVTSPLTGTVVAVDEYSTADGGRDWRVVVQPENRADLHVIIRRLQSPTVAVGDSVGVAQTVLGTVRAGEVATTEQNPLGLPSVWISIRPAMSEEAIDPYAPAVAATTAAS
ncbi:hypothetical protein [Euzebya rosea]|uniref:hypothetical protein n=1 Tax=Euzebya rosea TaxID=2052804 RepID=UPI000D3E8730|nr:hypothetical protein [Euzebya rosea]